MKKLISGVIVALSLVSVAWAGGDAAAGQAKAAVCGGCHGMDGNSAVPNFPKLAGLGERYLLKQIKDIKSGARQVPEMTGLLDALTEQDMADIAAYFNSKQRSEGVAPDKALAEKGRKIYMSGIKSKKIPACMACHSPTGQGNAAAGFPALAGQHSDYIVKQLKNFRSGARANDGDTRMMRTTAYNLHDTEIEAVAAFIQGLRKQ
ncbi:MAG: cytochrome c4 [Gammaproteobacteria bacterium]|nr:MAG: cytochrome c4 [Gammaproteobacteria bacterium]